MMSFQQITLVYIIPTAAILLLLTAAFHDIALRTIPNAVSTGLALIGIAFRMRDGGIVPSLLLAVVVFVTAVLCWQRGWMGGGDVKLIAATAFVVPPQQVGNLLLLTALCGGVLGVFYLALSRLMRAQPSDQPRGALRRILRAERWRICRGAPLPYGLAIAFGGITLLLTGS